MLRSFSRLVTGRRLLSSRRPPPASGSDEPFLTNPKDAMFLLEDGSFFRGRSFGASDRSVSGEAVFTTAMVGYPESLTDPSYRGQILVLTYPIIGNYGVPPDETCTRGLSKWFESRDGAPKISGLVVSKYSPHWSHWHGRTSLGEWLAEHGIPAIEGCDTRTITQKLRVGGSKLAKIVVDGSQDIPFEDPYHRNLVDEVSIKSPIVLGKGPHHIVTVDCGIKNNILRELADDPRFTTTVVPWDWPIDEMDMDALFLGNGPGDPAMLSSLIDRIKRIMETRDIPIFGICLGNQLLSLAAGAETYKMKFGNRGVNHPVVDQFTRRVYITSQNHGFAVNQATLPPDWVPYFINANDGTNEGIIHTSKPWSCAQFHPEAKAGPYDTMGMFRTFLDKVVECQTTGVTTPYDFVREKVGDRSVKKVVILGSGGLQIGQAGEFDYSGAQAIKAFAEEGVETVLINPNIATIQTGRGMADKVYFLPVTPEYIEEVFKKERPDAVVLGFGGQTALNTGVELDESGILEKYGVRVIGTPVSTIRTAEDRELFNAALAEIDVSFARSEPAETVDEAVRIGNEIGFPVMIRSAYSLGGLGSGICNDEHDLRERATKALAVCPQVLVEESLKGWKEVEYEVVRDAYDNCVTVCNMENFDPMGIHTGESIVIAPSQTLTNEEYYNLRSVAIRVIRHLGIIGECNIQYTLDPHSQQYRVIEVNPRLSRSSALASKATGYPLAAVAARLGLGIPLPDIRNSVTKNTTACFEPSLDYCVVKMPRWDLGKFPRVDKSIGTVMKSVGEVMAVGRNFGEALQKACRMTDSSSVLGFEPLQRRTGFVEGEAAPAVDVKRITDELENPTNQRIYAIADALESGAVSLDGIREITGIDRWWLRGLEELVDVKRELASHTIPSAPRALVRRAKVLGFSDRQLARHLLSPGDEPHGSRTALSTKEELSRELSVRERRKSLGITPFIKQIDTLAAEFPAYTNYLYVTYDASSHDVTVNDPTARRVVVLGSGCYRIGSSVEFDYCTVSTSRALRAKGVGTVIINYNPETVSTDYDESDRLYFEEISFERVMDIYEAEMARGVVVSMGGQEPQNIALRLAEAGARVYGTDPRDIDRAEDRQKFSAMLDAAGIDQPRWAELTSTAEAKRFADEVGFPLLIRPSYVLSGAAMAVAHTPEQLDIMLGNAAAVSDEYPVVMTKFHLGCKEIEVDAIADRGTLVNWAVSEHVENAGVHSGDATMVFPADTIGEEIKARALDIAARIAKELNISGPCNTQLLYDPSAKTLKVIETNLRAARSFPFVSKALGVDFLETATRVFLAQDAREGLENNGQNNNNNSSGSSGNSKTPSHSIPKNVPVSAEPIQPDIRCTSELPYLCVKSPMFSFMRLAGADPQLGVEMKSTGEVAAFGRSRSEALIKSMVSARGYRFPIVRCLLTLSPRNPGHKEVAAAMARAQDQGKVIVIAGDKETAEVLAASNCDVHHTCPKGIAREAAGEARAEIDAASAVGLVRLAKDYREKEGSIAPGAASDPIGSVDLVVDLADPDDTTSARAHAHYLLRRSAADFGVGLVTDPGLAAAFLDGVAEFNTAGKPLPVLSWDEYLAEAPHRTDMEQKKGSPAEAEKKRRAYTKE